jgi:hypothetical protein
VKDESQELHLINLAARLIVDNLWQEFRLLVVLTLLKV